MLPQAEKILAACKHYPVPTGEQAPGLSEALYTLSEAGILDITPEDLKLAVQVYSLCHNRKFTNEMRM